MIIGIPKESLTGENRVAASPTSVSSLRKLGFNVQIQKGAGIKASFTDHDFYQAEGQIVLADIGHYESEQFTKDLIDAHLSKKITKFF